MSKRIRRKIVCKNCGNKRGHAAFGLCRSCYEIKRKSEKTAICEKCGEKKPIEAHGLCRKCYQQTSKIVLWRRRTKLKYNYNITVAEYDEMLESQGNSCWICGKTPEENGRRLCVDHDHETGENRGLLCTCCNTALGQFQDNVQFLNRAIEYLLYWETMQQ